MGHQAACTDLERLGVVHFGAKTGPSSTDTVVRGNGDHTPLMGGDNGRGRGSTTGRRQVMVGSVGKTSLTTIFLNSKSGRCPDVGALGVLDEAGEDDDGRGRGQQRREALYIVLSRHWAMVGSVGKMRPIAMFPHSKSGRCTVAGLVAVLGRVGEGNVGVGRGCQQWAKYWGHMRILGRTRSVRALSIDAQWGSSVTAVIGRRCLDVGGDHWFIPSLPPGIPLMPPVP
ncbi:hypothetical protein EDD18DRAFT_1107303 [Armillaria luteobubalina]|uniref:Uncharacterized protein n=1 Tax=Armillaria luteobubalina TaxID=153913 RepID=A0AA39Q3Q9_9AGAR|nr:hypothetical protein EDD18DRAFT_1107303 [Armillaria luteobubalina]